MIGRGAYGRPWLIAQVMSELGGGGHRPDPSLDEQLATMLEQYDEMLQLYGTQTGVNLARKHIGWYTKGLPGLGGAAQQGQPAGRSGGCRSHVAGILFAVARALGGLSEMPRTRVCCFVQRPC